MNYSARASALLFCLLMGLSSSTGCLRVAPKIPAPINASAIDYTTQPFEADVKDYRTDMSDGKLQDAQRLRDQICYRVLAQIDRAYGGFELSLSTSRAGVQTATDAAQLGLTAAATVTGTTAIKDILTATSTAFQGTRLSFDKNFFEQKTTEALVSQMRAARTTLKAQMLRSLSNRDVSGYPLEAAWTDLVSYYYAGTIPSALVDIATKAGNDAATASQELKKAVRDLTPATPEQARESISIRSAYQKLNTAVSSGSTEEVNKAVISLRKILDIAKVSYKYEAQPTQLLAAFRAAIIAAGDDDSLLNKLNEGVQEAFGKE